MNSFKKILFVITGILVLLNIPETVMGQYKLEKHASWNDNENIVPVGGQYYNDLVGYVDTAGREYAIMGSVDGTYFIDVTDPENPELVEKIAGKYGGGENRDFQTLGHYAYGVSDQGGSSLQIFDLRYLPDSVEKIYDEDSLLIRSHNIFVDNDRLYLAMHTAQDGYHPISVLSVEDPDTPRFIANLEPPKIDGSPLFEECHDVHVRNDSLFCFGGFDGLFIYDYEDPKRPRLISARQNYPHQGYNHSGWVNENGNGIVFADETHGTALKYYDISDWSDPQFVSVFGHKADDGSIPHNPLIKDSLIYVSYYHNGVVVFDKSDPDNIEKIASYDTYPESIDDDGNPTFNGFQGCWGVYPFLPSGNIIASDMTNGLFVLSLEEDPYANVVSQNSIHEKAEIYPNPAGDLINIRFPGQGSWKVDIFDKNGRSVQKAEFQITDPGRSEKLTLDPNLSPGMYIVHFNNGASGFHKKLIKR